MTPADARRLLEVVTGRWVDDPDTDAVWAGAFEGRWGLRLAQRSRDYTTMWFDVGDITVGFEAYLMPNPPHGHEAVFRHCLLRNATAWPAAIHMDRSGDLYVGGRVPLPHFDEGAIDLAVGAVHEVVDLSFRPLVALGFLGQ